MKTYLLALMLVATAARAATDLAVIDEQIGSHPGETGAYVLERGEEALLARAWLADHAEHSIEVQYFIWSTDNIGILAAESILRAADRGIQVRIIVDDLLVDAPDKSLLALAHHPRIDIRIYSPKKSVGVPTHKRIANVVTDFRGFNQRMHDKTFIVDGKVAITGGRNMSSEYYDYSHEYNFRDRDALLAGEVVKEMRASFERFWRSEQAVNVESLYGGLGVTKKNVRVNDAEVEQSYRALHAYANSPENFTPEVHAAIEGAALEFVRIVKQTVWGPVEFVSDQPGKNSNRVSLGGGGITTAALVKLVESAKNRIVIQSPYLVLSDEALALFQKTLARGVSIRINTNSLASTDNLPAFSGYRAQRERMLKMGLKIYEYRPDAQAHRQVRARELVGQTAATISKPIFGLHAKTMVVDGNVVFIGTFNLDPRSQNLNTEVGAIVRNERVASAVEVAIETDMQPFNSWNAATDNPDQFATRAKRNKARLWRTVPITPLL